MKKFFNLFICLLLCFSFSTYVQAEDDLDVNDEFVDEYEDEEDEDYDGVEEDEDYDGEDDFGEESDYEDFEEEDDYSNEDMLDQDANVENSQTSDIPIILISTIAIVSLIVVLSKKNIFINNRI